ncbi:MAG: glycosyltransferase family 2 protein [Spirochaetes bacterium]|nr:glycosyltransferase family 2 protein [Spirochaetota bacterium]
MDVAVSVVTYNTEPSILKQLIKSLGCTSLDTGVTVVDNSPSDGLKAELKDSGVTYIHNPANPGYGAANNIALRRTLGLASYQLVINPDVYFTEDVPGALYGYMEEHTDIGLVMPAVLFPNGSMQYLCKLLPRPFNLAMRLLLPQGGLSDRLNRRFELRDTGYGRVMDVPYLSGCFMFIRSAALEAVGLFDERFFMYLEDTDLSRRIHARYRTVYYPNVSVFHCFDRLSKRNRHMRMMHIQSAIRYFNKWGWFFDRERRRVNRETVEALREEGIWPIR